jgi:hypothetical protein
MALPDPRETPTITAEVYAELLSCSTWAIYKNRDTLPVPAIAVGRALRWPTAQVLASLGLEDV